jgi:hypothetical protein
MDPPPQHRRTSVGGRRWGMEEAGWGNSIEKVTEVTNDWFYGQTVVIPWLETSLQGRYGPKNEGIVVAPNKRKEVSEYERYHRNCLVQQ